LGGRALGAGHLSECSYQRRIIGFGEEAAVVCMLNKAE
jgi:hypothetical protein